jgi:hypothetical protein
MVFVDSVTGLPYMTASERNNLRNRYNPTWHQSCQGCFSGKNYGERYCNNCRSGSPSCAICWCKMEDWNAEKCTDCIRLKRSRNMSLWCVACPERYVFDGDSGGCWKCGGEMGFHVMDGGAGQTIGRVCRTCKTDCFKTLTRRIDRDKCARCGDEALSAEYMRWLRCPVCKENLLDGRTRTKCIWCDIPAVPWPE